MDAEQPVAALPYATPAHRRPRRWPRLPTSLAVAVVICGTLLIATPTVAVCVLMGQNGYSVPDYVMGLLWATGGVGLLIVLLGVFLAAPSRRPARRKIVPAPIPHSHRPSPVP
jgi:hypothetical protein